MRVEVLVAAVGQQTRELAQTMNLETDAVIVNQCDHYGYEEFTNRNRKVRCFHASERGVGLSRNTALMRAEKEIILFSDEDIVLHCGYEQVILDAFARNPDADMILFNVKVDPSRKTYYNTDIHRIHWYNYGRYPAYAIAARTGVLRRAGVTYPLLFGGGAVYSNGEDSLFLHDCLKKGLHLYTETAEIGEEILRPSTWFSGFTEKFFRDRGVLYHYLYGRLAVIWALRFVLKKRKEMCKEIPAGKAIRLMTAGIREGKDFRGQGRSEE